MAGRSKRTPTRRAPAAAAPTTRVPPAPSAQSRKRRTRDLDSDDSDAALAPQAPSSATSAADDDSEDDDDFMAAEIDGGSDSDSDPGSDAGDDEDEEDDEHYAAIDALTPEQFMQIAGPILKERLPYLAQQLAELSDGELDGEGDDEYQPDGDSDEDEALDGDDEEEDEDEDEENEDDEDAGSDSDLDDDVDSDPDSHRADFYAEKPKERLIRPEIIPDTDSDDSDADLDHVNTVGNVPMEWYNDYPHIGYDLDGKKVMKPAVGDELDKFLSKMDDPKYWTSVHDKQDQKDVELTEDELAIIQKLQKAEYAADGFDPYQPTVEWFTSKTEIHPLSAAPEPKRRFVPSKWEHKKVMKIVRAIRNGWIVPNKPKVEKPKYFDIWGADTAESRDDHPMHLPAPKMALPGHIESYNPPEEYLFTEEEKQAWLDADPEDRKIDFIPQKFTSLRAVPAYDQFTQNRFQRCLDLYLCPRVRRNRVEVDPDSLIPRLPDPKDLEPFPTALSIAFRGHTGSVRSFALSPTGQFMLSGSDDGSLRLWEVATARCLQVWNLGEPVVSVAWNPSKSVAVAAVAFGQDVAILNLGSTAVAFGVAADAKAAKTTTTMLAGDAAPVAAANSASGQRLAPKCEWRRPARALAAQGVAWTVHHGKPVATVAWHRKGDYFVTTTPNHGAASVMVHQLARKQSQQPFKKNKGLVITAQFHPTKPHLLVATQRYVRIYDLVAQDIVKKLTSGVKWISSMDQHPSGDHVIVGAYDRRLCWWDLELGVKPYKTLRYHQQALRSVAFHPSYPLFASSSDDGTIQIFHGMVYADLMTNPLIVPVKILRAHAPVNSLGALNLRWHPTQPWLISSGADGVIKLWT
ncbi:Ribosome biogenesis protein 1 [Allomyces javanicus]|nr:Ribosome biogenesis protein 1 [Allomyces javanicus]